MSDSVETIESLRAEERRLAELISALQKRRHALECEAAGVKVGDVVLYKGNEYLVTKVDTWASPPWVYGNPKKKDGTFGIQERCLYSHWVKP